MIAIIGKTASGKTAVRDILVSKYGYKPIVTYTTRPMRAGEKQGITYNYIERNEFLRKILNEEFVDWTCYAAKEGNWFYGTPKSEFENPINKSVIILTPEGVRTIKKKGYKLQTVYLKSDEGTIRQRLKNRGDDTCEAERRIKSDNKDFAAANIYDIVDVVIENNLDDDIQEVALEIIQTEELK